MGNCLMSDSLLSLSETASAVEALGACQEEIDLLDDTSLAGGMRAIREHEQQLQKYKLWLAAAVARRSGPTLGYDGLARKSGFPTPATFIQSMTGGSLDDATKLARLGQSIVEAEVSGAQPSPVAVAAVAGGISLDAADAIRRGLGKPDGVVGETDLRVAAEELIAWAQTETAWGSVTPEALLKRARQVRGELDLEAIERGEKERASMRYVRRWSRDGMSGGSWALPDEDGGAEIDTALRLLLAKTTGGPRFPETDSNGNPVEKTETERTAEKAVADTRTPEQVLADGFAQIFHNGIAADPTVVPGASRAAVRVIVEQDVLKTRIGSGLLDETLSVVSFGKLEEYLCEGGTIDVVFGTDGSMNLGRTKRLFTPRQRTALGVRDGGCRFPGCTKPPSWCEAHHINYWARDHGQTNLTDGILLCRYHHMLTHNNGWETTRDNSTEPGGGYWLKPPTTQDPEQRLIPMPSKNPIVAAMQLARQRIAPKASVSSSVSESVSSPAPA
jgi:Domain of unknown function (DUF222)